MENRLKTLLLVICHKLIFTFNKTPHNKNNNNYKNNNNNNDSYNLIADYF